MSLSRELGEDPMIVAAHIDDIFFNREYDRLIEESDVQQATPSGYSSISAIEMDMIFRWLWLSAKFGEYHNSLILKIFRSDTVEWYDKCLIVSAISISLLNYFDIQKFMLLMEFSEAHQDQVYQRALTGLILALMAYDKRIVFYPELSHKLNQLSQDENLCKDIELILLQLLMARETEKIGREFEEEVLPEMKKMMPKIEINCN